MDGYALRASEASAPLAVAGRALAGEPHSGTLPPGSCIEIATGAVLPDGADSVLPFEHAVREGATVRATRSVRLGEAVSPRGGDVRRGEVVLPRGAELSPSRVALAGSLGLARVRVLARPRIAVLPSGSEVAVPGERAGPGGVFDGNSFAIAALVRRCGGAPSRTRPVPDDGDALAAALRDAAHRSDLVVTTGGSSVGERDLLAPAVEAAGKVHVHGVRLKPGKPVLVGVAHGTPVLGLPGYPASALVTAEILLAPAVRRLAGLPPAEAAWRRAPLAHDVRKASAQTLVLPVRFLEDGRAASTYKESGTLTSVTSSWGYVEVPEGVELVPAGSVVEVRRWT